MAAGHVEQAAAQPPNCWERCLVVVMRVFAVGPMLAIVPAFMPRAWMAAIHEQLGLGPFPGGPIVEYLARSTSVFYALHGGLLLLISMDVRRFAPVLSFVIWTGLAAGVGLLVMDWMIGLPPPWSATEGPIVMALCGTLLFLKTKARVA
ncbi:MAG: hypothetical protein NTW87_27455 [Planctomycetota bacterium]|nr:hypothetical protein [Planctomycetota bacterium]